MENQNPNNINTTTPTDSIIGENNEVQTPTDSVGVSSVNSGSPEDSSNDLPGASFKTSGNIGSLNTFNALSASSSSSTNPLQSSFSNGIIKPNEQNHNITPTFNLPGATTNDTRNVDGLTFASGGQTTLSGTSQEIGLSFDPYKKHIRGTQIVNGSVEDLNRQRAQNQSGWSQAGNALLGTVLNILPEVAMQVGNLFTDWNQADSEYANEFTQTMDEIKQSVNEALPIYRENPEKTFDITDSAWWFDGGRNVVTSGAAFVLIGRFTGMGISSLLQGGARGAVAATNALRVRGAQAADVLSRTKKYTDGLRQLTLSNSTLNTLNKASVLANSVLLNQMETTGVQTETFKEAYELKLEELKADPKNAEVADDILDRRAREFASEKSSIAGKINRINILLNITSLNLLGSPLLNTTRQQIAKVGFKESAKTVGKEMVQEYGEETINAISKDMAIENRYGIDDIFDLATRPETLEAGFWGAIGGATQTGFTQAIKYVPTHKNTNYTKAYSNKVIELTKEGKLSASEIDLKAREYATNLAGTDSKRVSQHHIESVQRAKFEEELKKLETKFDPSEVKQLTTLMHTYKDRMGLITEIKRLQEDGEFEKAKLLQEQMMTSTILSSFSNGTTQFLEDSLRELASLSQEQLVENGLATDVNDTLFKTNVEEALKDLTALEKMYNKANTYLDSDTLFNDMLTKHEYEKFLNGKDAFLDIAKEFLDGSDFEVYNEDGKLDETLSRFIDNFVSTMWKNKNERDVFNFLQTTLVSDSLLSLQEVARESITNNSSTDASIFQDAYMAELRKASLQGNVDAQGFISILNEFTDLSNHLTKQVAVFRDNIGKINERIKTHQSIEHQNFIKDQLKAIEKEKAEAEARAVATDNKADERANAERLEASRRTAEETANQGTPSIEEAVAGAMNPDNTTVQPEATEETSEAETATPNTVRDTTGIELTPALRQYADMLNPKSAKKFTQLHSRIIKIAKGIQADIQELEDAGHPEVASFLRTRLANEQLTSYVNLAEDLDITIANTNNKDVVTVLKSIKSKSIRLKTVMLNNLGEIREGLLQVESENSAIGTAVEEAGRPILNEGRFNGNQYITTENEAVDIQFLVEANEAVKQLPKLPIEAQIGFIQQVHDIILSRVKDGIEAETINGELNVDNANKLANTLEEAGDSFSATLLRNYQAIEKILLDLNTTIDNRKANILSKEEIARSKERARETQENETANVQQQESKDLETQQIQSQEQVLADINARAEQQIAVISQDENLSDEEKQQAIEQVQAELEESIEALKEQQRSEAEQQKAGQLVVRDEQAAEHEVNKSEAITSSLLLENLTDEQVLHINKSRPMIYDVFDMLENRGVDVADLDTALGVINSIAGETATARAVDVITLLHNEKFGGSEVHPLLIGNNSDIITAIQEVHATITDVIANKDLWTISDNNTIDERVVHLSDVLHFNRLKRKAGKKRAITSSRFAWLGKEYVMFNVSGATVKQDVAGEVRVAENDPRLLSNQDTINEGDTITFQIEEGADLTNLGKIPIQIIHNGTVVKGAYLHVTDWINSDNLVADATDFELERNQLLQLRQAIVDAYIKGETISTTIVEVTPGVLNTNPLGKSRASDVFSELPLYIVRNGKIYSDINTVYSDNAKGLKNGTVLVALPSVNNDVTLHPLNRGGVTPEVNYSIITAVRAAITDSGDANYKALLNAGFDISSMMGLRDYLSNFINVDTDISLSSDEFFNKHRYNTAIRVTNNSVEFTHNNKNYFISPAVIKENPNVLNTLLQNLSDALEAYYMTVNLKTLNAQATIPIFSREGVSYISNDETNDNQGYSEWAKQNLFTKAEPITLESGEVVYNIQKSFIFDYSNTVQTANEIQNNVENTSDNNVNTENAVQTIEDVNTTYESELFGDVDTTISDDSLDEMDFTLSPDTVNEAAEFSQESNYYEGNIKPEPNTVFVFGSNPEGRHGAGAAKVAREQFGAIYGQGEGLQGNAYALPTKDLRVKENKGFKSISPEQITDSIKKLYEIAKQNPNKRFKVAYRNTTDTSLNGYTGLEMIEMFNQAGAIPTNIIFSKEWVDTGKLNTQSAITNTNITDTNITNTNTIKTTKAVSIEGIQDDYTFITNVPANIQHTLVSNVVNRLLSHALSSPDNVIQVEEGVRDILNILTDRRYLIENKSKSVNKERAIEILDSLIANEDVLVERIKNNISALGLFGLAKELNIKIDQQQAEDAKVADDKSNYTLEDTSIDGDVETTGREDSEDTSNYSDGSYLKIDPATKLSTKNKYMLVGIRNGRLVDGEFQATKDPLTGLEIYVPFDKVYATLINILATNNNRYITPNYNNFLQVIKDNVKTKPYLQDVVTKLENATEAQRSSFVKNFNMQYSSPTFINSKRNENGVMESKVTNSDSRDAALASVSTWNNNLRMSDYLSNANGVPAFKQGVKDLVNKFNEGFTNGTIELNYDNVRRYFGYFGIEISPAVFSVLSIDGYEGYTLQQAFNKNTNAPFGIMAKAMSNNIDMQNKSIFDESVFKNLASFIGEYSDDVLTSSYRSIEGQMQYGYTQSKRIIDAFSKVKYDIDYLQTKYDNVFNSLTDSQIGKNTDNSLSWMHRLLKFDANGVLTINTDSTFYKSLSYTTPEGLKRFSRGKSIDKLTPYEYELTRLAYFMNNKLEVNKTPIYGFFGLTMSDKSVPVLFKATGVRVNLQQKDGRLTMKEDDIVQKDEHYNGRIIKAGTIRTKGDDTLMMEALVFPEISRMLAHKELVLGSNDTSNIDAWDRGGNRFFTIPTLNTIDYLFETVRDGDGAIVTRYIKNDVMSDPKARMLIKTAIRTSMMEAIERKRMQLLEVGIIERDLAGGYKFNSNVSELSHIENDNALDNFLYNYIYNYRVANFNQQQLLIGDPVLHFTDKATRKPQQAIERLQKARYTRALTTDEQVELNDAVQAYNEAYTSTFYEETFDNQGKRLAADNATGELGILGEDYVDMLILPDEVKSSSIIGYMETLLLREGQTSAEKKIANKVLDGFRKINSTDAQEFVTLREHLLWLYAEDKISEDTMNELNNLYDNKLPIDWRAFEERGVILTPRKPQYVANFVRDSSPIPIESRLYIKSSAIPLIRDFTRGMPIDKIRAKMEDRASLDTTPRYERAAFESAVKVGLPPSDKLEGGFAVRVPRSGYITQQQVPYDEGKHKINEGTQDSKLKYINLMNVEGFVDPFSGEVVNGRKLYENNFKIYDELFAIKKAKLIKELGYNESTGTVNIKLLSERLIKEGISRGFSENELLAFAYNEDSGQLRVPLWLTVNDGKVQSLLNSIVDNGIRKRKVRGKSYVLASDFGIGTERMTNDITWIGDPVSELKPHRNENGEVVGGEIIIPFDVFDEHGNRLFIEDYLDDNNNLRTDLLGKDVLKSLGFRIPTQDMGSMHTFKVVGFLPSYMKDTVYAPKELVAQMGSDFDVDKLYNYFYNTYIEPTTGVITKISLDNIEELEAIMENPPANLREQALENANLDYHFAIMENPSEEVQRQVYSPVDNVEFVKGTELAEEFNNLRASKGKVSYFDEDYQAYKYLNAVSGKDAVGSFALDSNLNAIAQTVKDNIRFIRHTKGGMVFEKLSLFDDDNGKAIVGNYINNEKLINGVGFKSDVIKAFLSMAVDNEKLQVLGKLNINNSTLDFVRAAAFSGFNVEQIVTFLNHPSIIAYINDLRNNRNEYLLSINTELAGITSEHLEEGGASITIDNKLTFADIKSQLSNEVFEIAPEIALRMIDTFKQFTGNGKALKEIQSAINSDSSGIGKNVFQSSIKQSKILGLSQSNVLNADKLIGDFYYPSRDNKYQALELQEREAYLLAKQEEGYVLIDTSNTGYTDSLGINPDLVYIKPITINGLASVQATIFNNELWDKLVPYNQQKMSIIFNNIIANLNSTYRDIHATSTNAKAAFMKEVADDFKSYLFSTAALNNSEFNTVEELRADLMLDTATNQSLASFIASIQSNNVNNRLLSRITAFIEDINNTGKIPSTIGYNATSAETIDSDLIVQSIIELLENNTVIGQRNGKDVTGYTLMRDLINYQIVNGALQKANQFIKYIPIRYLENTGIYKTAIKNYRSVNNTEAFVTQFIQHHPEYFSVSGSEMVLGGNMIEIPEATSALQVFKDGDMLYVYKNIPDTNYFVKLDIAGDKGRLEYDYTKTVAITNMYMQSGDSELSNATFNNKQGNIPYSLTNSSNKLPYTFKSMEDNKLVVGSAVNYNSEEQVVVAVNENLATVISPLSGTISSVPVSELDVVGTYFTIDNVFNQGDMLVTDTGDIINVTKQKLVDTNPFDISSMSSFEYQAIKEEVVELSIKNALETRSLPEREASAIDAFIANDFVTDDFVPAVYNTKTKSMVERFGINTNDPVTILSSLVENINDPIAKMIAQKLLSVSPAFEGIEFIVDTNLKAKGITTRSREADGNVTTIRINPDKINTVDEFASVLLEEALHGFTINNLNSNPEIKARLEMLFNRTKNAIIKKYGQSAYDSMLNKVKLGKPLSKGVESDLLYSVSNIHEFIAASVKNKEFQKVMNAIKGNNITKQSIWERFINAITDLLVSLGVVKDSYLHLALHDTISLIDNAQIDGITNVKDILADKAYYIKSKQTIIGKFGLQDANGKLIPIANADEVADFINNHIENLIAIADGPYVDVQYTTDVTFNKPERTFETYEEVREALPVILESAEVLPNLTQVTYGGKSYYVRGYAKDGKVLLADLDGRPKRGGGVNINNVTVVNVNNLPNSNTNNQLDLFSSPDNDTNTNLGILQKVKDYSLLSDTNEESYTYSMDIDIAIDIEEDYDFDATPEQLAQMKAMNLNYITTLKDRIYDINKLINNIYAETPTTPEQIADNKRRGYEARLMKSALNDEKRALVDRVFKDNTYLSLDEFKFIATEELDHVARLLKEPLTADHLIYIERIVNYWKNSRKLMFSPQDFDTDMNTSFLAIEDRATRQHLELIGIFKQYTQDNLLTDSLDTNLSIDAIMNTYIAKGAFTANVADLTTMGNSLLSAIGISIKQKELEAKREYDTMFKDIDDKIAKAYRSLRSTSKNGMLYHIMMQEFPEGGYTQHLITRESFEFNRKKQALREYYKEQGRDKGSARYFQKWLEDEAEVSDLNMYFTEDGAITPEIEANREDLRAKLGDVHYYTWLDAQEKLLDRYRDSLDGEKYRISEMHGIKIEDVDIDGSASIDMGTWRTQFSPFTVKATLSNTNYVPRVRGYDFFEIIPRVDKAEYFDSKFKTIASNPALMELHDTFTKTWQTLYNYLDARGKRDVIQNGLPEIEATVLDEFLQKGFGMGVKPVIEAFIDTNRGNEAAPNIDIASGKVEKRMVSGFNRTKANSVKEQLRQRKLAYILDKKEIPTTAMEDQWHREIVNQNVMDGSGDLGKLFKTFGASVLGFKHKSRIENDVKIANTVIGSYTERLRNSKGLVFGRDNTPIEKPSAEESFVHEKAMVNHTMDKLFYGGGNQKILGQKVYTPKEKELIADVDKRIAQIREFANAEQGSQERYLLDSYLMANNFNTPNELINSLEKYKNSLGRQIDYAKVGNTVLQYVQIKGMGWNVVGGVSNVLFGTIANFIEGSNRRVFDNKDLIEGYKVASASVLRSIAFNSVNKGEALKLRIAMDSLDILKESSTEASMSTISDPRFRKLRFLSPYNVNQRGEYLNQAPLLITIAKKTKVTLENGEQISLWDGFDNNFEWQTDKYGAVPQATIDKMKLKVDQVIKLTHGNYDPSSPMMLKKHLAGRALTQFRTWLIDSVRGRFGDWQGRHDDILDVTVKGRYVSAIHGIKARPGAVSLAILSETAKKFIPNIGPFAEMRNSVTTLDKLGADIDNIDGLEMHDINNIRAVATELAMLITINLILWGLTTALGDLDDEETAWLNFMINQGTRVRTDILLYTNPAEAKKLLDDPFPAVAVIDDMNSILSAGYDTITGEGSYKTGVYAGESKFVHKLANAIPFFNSPYRIYKSSTQVFDK